MRIEKLKLKNLINTRDLGGFPTTDGKKIKRNKLIRSGRLYKLTDKTVETFKQMGLSAVIDLRTDKEIEEYPVEMIEGSTYYRFPLTCTATTGLTHERSMAGTMHDESKRVKKEFGTAKNYMQCMYEILLFSEYSQSQLKEFFKVIATTDGCVLWHCSAGKDRTGLCAMLLEWLLGVEEKVIIEDYVASNRFQRRLRLPQRLGLIIAPITISFKKFLYAQIKADPKYIINSMNAIKERYGTIENYCIQAVGITEEDIKAIKDKCLE